MALPLKNRALSPLQAVGVVVGLAAIAATGYGIYWAASHLIHQRHVRAHIPRCLEILRADRDRLSHAIEKYHSQFGYYPPDHSTNKEERARINSLYYELVGTRWLPQSKAYGVPTAKDMIKPEAMQKLFGMSAFSNSLVYPSWPTNFLDGTELLNREEEDIFMVSAPLPEEFVDELEDFALTPWRYLADPAEHNKGKFDIWVELDVLGQHFVIGNWPEAK